MFSASGNWNLELSAEEGGGGVADKRHDPSICRNGNSNGSLSVSFGELAVELACAFLTISDIWSVNSDFKYFMMSSFKFCIVVTPASFEADRLEAAGPLPSGLDLLESSESPSPDSAR